MKYSSTSWAKFKTFNEQPQKEQPGGEKKFFLKHGIDSNQSSIMESVMYFFSFFELYIW